MWCCVTPERDVKTGRIMDALAEGCGGTVCMGEPPSTTGTFAIWGHEFLSEKMIPYAHSTGRPYWFVDNGYWKPAQGGVEGYYSLTYCGLSPVMLPEPDTRRLPVAMSSWEYNDKGYVLLALPGMGYGKMIGLDMKQWSEKIVDRIRKYTNRRIVIRKKGGQRSLKADLRGAAVLVTHSSKVAVEAIVAGVPCIVEPSNPAASVCATSLEMIDQPVRPDRNKWWASLMCQQFTLDEMRNGTASYWMKQIEASHVGTIHR